MRSNRHPRRFAVAGAVLWLLGGCGDKYDPIRGDVRDEQPTPTAGPPGPTPTPVPTELAVTYEDDVKSFLDAKCVRCHDSDQTGLARRGAPADVNWDTYEDAVTHAERGNARIQAGTMPPFSCPDCPDVTAGERVLFQRWIDDGLQRGPR